MGTNEMIGIKYLAQHLTDNVLWLTKLHGRKVVFIMVRFGVFFNSLLFCCILTAGTGYG